MQLRGSRPGDQTIYVIKGSVGLPVVPVVLAVLVLCVVLVCFRFGVRCLPLVPAVFFSSGLPTALFLCFSRDPIFVGLRTGGCEYVRLILLPLTSAPPLGMYV